MASLLVKAERFDVLEVGDVFVVRWCQSPTIAALHEIERAMTPALARHPEGFGWVAIPCSENPREASFSKEASAQADRMKAKGLRAIAAVQNDDSIGGKLARIALQVISVMSSGLNIRLFRDVHDACLWMASAVPGVDAATLETVARSGKSEPPSGNQPGSPVAA